MGLRFAALTAGIMPKRIPMSMENTTATALAGMLTADGAPETDDTTRDAPMPAATPRMPPRLVRAAASVRNCHRMRRFRAPMAFLRPISRVRSVTVTSMMFMTPMPPTRSEMPAIQRSCRFVAFARACICSACSMRFSLL